MYQLTMNNYTFAHPNKKRKSNPATCACRQKQYALLLT
jgi:hypothetical protein